MLCVTKVDVIFTSQSSHSQHQNHFALTRTQPQLQQKTTQLESLSLSAFSSLPHGVPDPGRPLEAPGQRGFQGNRRSPAGPPAGDGDRAAPLLNLPITEPRLLFKTLGLPPLRLRLRPRRRRRPHLRRQAPPRPVRLRHTPRRRLPRPPCPRPQRAPPPEALRREPY